MTSVWPNVDSEFKPIYAEERKQFKMTSEQYAHEVAMAIANGNLKVRQNDVEANVTMFVDGNGDVQSGEEYNLKGKKWRWPKRADITDEEKELLGFVSGFFSERKSVVAIFNSLFAKVKRGEIGYFGDRFVNIKHIP